MPNTPMTSAHHSNRKTTDRLNNERREEHNATSVKPHTLTQLLSFAREVLFDKDDNSDKTEAGTRALMIIQDLKVPAKSAIELLMRLDLIEEVTELIHKFDALTLVEKSEFEQALLDLLEAVEIGRAVHMS